MGPNRPRPNGGWSGQDREAEACSGNPATRRVTVLAGTRQTPAVSVPSAARCTLLGGRGAIISSIWSAPPSPSSSTKSRNDCAITESSLFRGYNAVPITVNGKSRNIEPEASDHGVIDGRVASRLNDRVEATTRGREELAGNLLAAGVLLTQREGTASRASPRRRLVQEAEVFLGNGGAFRHPLPAGPLRAPGCRVTGARKA